MVRIILNNPHLNAFVLTCKKLPLLSMVFSPYGRKDKILRSARPKDCMCNYRVILLRTHDSSAVSRAVIDLTGRPRSSYTVAFVTLLSSSVDEVTRPV